MDLTRDRILEEVAQAKDLPAFPETVLRIEEEMAKKEPVLKTIANQVKQDPALAARFLKVANSAFYSRGVAVTAVEQSVMRLGFVEARKLALAVTVMQQYGRYAGKDPKAFWGHCLAVGLCTRVVAERASKPLSEEVVATAFTAGLLHDVGVLFLAHKYPEACEEIAAEIENEGGVSRDVEKKLLGIDHAEIGGALATRWSLPEGLASAIATHHTPWCAEDAHSELVQLVHIANFVCNNQGLGRQDSGFPDSFDHGAWDSLGLSLDQVSDLIEQTKEAGENCAVFMDAFGSSRSD